jgi:hypothetical protein
MGSANLQHFVPGGAAARIAQDKQTRYAVLLAGQEQPVAFQASSFETIGGLHADALALLQRLQELLSLLRKMWRAILSWVGCVSLLRPLWNASCSHGCLPGGAYSLKPLKLGR